MIFASLRNWIVSLASSRRVDGIPLPETGRSSVDGTLLSDRLSASLSSFAGVSPVIDFEILAVLKRLWLFNPDLSQYVANIVNLGNTGHNLMVDAASDSVAEAAVNRLNEASSRLYSHSAGVDGLINAYLTQMAWSGAISSEDVVNFAGRRVEQVVLVPVEQIRFLYLDGQFVPHQRPNSLMGTLLRGGAPLGLIQLNPATYRYFALSTVENSPYAKPPATAAVGAITGPQTDMVDNIKYIAQKFGLLGLITAAVTPPPRKPSEAEHEYQGRAQRYLASVLHSLEPNFKKGLLVTFRDQKLDHTNISGDARGAKDIFDLNEQQVMSGLAMQPAFFGRTDSTTETYADVVYNLLLGQVGNVQRLVKRRQEATYRLDLLLGGILVDGVSLVFNRSHARDDFRTAQAEQIRVDVSIKKAVNGIISPDEAAQEMGYESAFDPEILSAQPQAAKALQNVRHGAGARSQSFTATFRFDRSAQRYKFVPSRIDLSNAPVGADNFDNVLPLKKKAA